jgi:hypothetical protein
MVVELRTMPIKFDFHVEVEKHRAATASPYDAGKHGEEAYGVGAD